MRLLIVVSFLLFFLGSVGACAQNNAKDFIVTVKRDTIFGEVAMKKPNQNFSKISFRGHQESQHKEYETKSIIGFFDNVWGLYEVKIVPFTNTDPSQHGTWAENTAIVKYDTVFVSVIIKGRVDFYQHKSHQDGERFYLQKTNQITELYSLDYVKTIGDKSLMVKGQQFVSTLNQNLSECNSIYSSIQKTKLSKKSLLTLGSVYYTCLNEKPSYQTTIDNGKLEIGLTFGFLLNKAEGQGEKFAINNSFSGGAFFNYFLSKRKPNLSIMNQFLLSKIETSGKGYVIEYDENLLDLVKRGLVLNYDFLNLRIVNQLSYRFNTLGKVKPFLSTGIVTNLRLSNNSTVKKGGSPESDNDHRGYSPGFSIDLGVVYNRFELLYSYETSVFTNNPYPNFYVKSSGFSVRCRLGKG